jgi:hypothetical protein
LGWVAASARKRARAAAVAGEEEWRRRWVAGMGRGASVSDRVRGERDGGGKEQRSSARGVGVGKWRAVRRVGAAEDYVV